MNTEAQIPAGYRQDSLGRLVPESQIKPVDALRDDLVRNLVEQAHELRDALHQYKSDAFDEIQAFVEQSAAEYGVKLGGRKGNLQLMSYDGQYKIIVAVAEHISFDERLQAAKALIDKCLSEWTEGARPELATIVHDAFRVDQQGNIRTAQVLSLRRLDIKDGRWKTAMDAIHDAIQVTGSKRYIRLYERIGQSDRYAPIALDVAGV